MRNFTVKKSGHNWLVTDQVTGFSEFILSNETQPKAVLLELADDYINWHQYNSEGNADKITDEKVLITANFLSDIDFTLSDAQFLQYELGAEACSDPSSFYGGVE